ncbi:MAG TPA: LEA type 2 family protein [Gammaproteobacteria bacterium]
MTRTSVVCFGMVIFLAGCTFNRLASKVELQEPTFSYLRHEVTSLNETKADVNFIINAYNPNPVGLKNVYVDYALLTEGSQFLKGQGLPLKLNPAGDTEITVPTEIVFIELINSLGPVVERILRTGDYSVPVTINGVIYGKPTLYDEFEEGTSLLSFNWEFSRTENIPLPEQQIKNFIMQMMLKQKIH